MNLIATLRSLSRDQRNAFIASFFGWALDAFDFFLLVFVLADVAKTFHTNKAAAAVALTLTLAMRPVGALLFGLAGDRYGRRAPLIINVIVYSALELLTGFSPTLGVFLVLRALFGIGMGGEWGLGASLALESVPAASRGVLSGLLQEGYPTGYLLATLVFWLAYPYVGWRGMFFIGAVPALLSLFIYFRVKESPVWLERNRVATADAKSSAGRQKQAGELRVTLTKNIGLFLYLVVLMAGFNFMSHGTQDLYPTLLESGKRFSHSTISLIAIIYNVGAIVGGVFFGSLSERIGRRKAIVIAALLGLPIIPLWALSPTAGLIALGAFLMQVMVQGAWGVIPAHLSELSPPMLRGTFTGFAYQCGNLIASVNAPLQIWIASRYFGGEDRGLASAMACVIAVVLILVALVTAAGHEKHGVDLAS